MNHVSDDHNLRFFSTQLIGVNCEYRDFCGLSRSKLLIRKLRSKIRGMATNRDGSIKQKNYIHFSVLIVCLMAMSIYKNEIDV